MTSRARRPFLHDSDPFRTVFVTFCHRFVTLLAWPGVAAVPKVVGLPGPTWARRRLQNHSDAVQVGLPLCPSFLAVTVLNEDQRGA